jgi:large subunit ribosomal protein L28
MCDYCGKKTTTGNSVSHSHRKTRRTWLPNVKKMRVREDGHVTRKTVCTRCLRSGKAEKAL